MAEDKKLEDYLRENEPEGFRPSPCYVPENDSMTFFFRNNESFARRIDGLLTIYLSLDTEDLVGFEIKGVRHILSSVDEFGIQFSGGKVKTLVTMLAVQAEVSHRR